MAHKFAEIGFTDAVKSVQQTMGSRSAYARREVGSTGNVATDSRISLLLIDSPKGAASRSSVECMSSVPKMMRRSRQG